MSGGGHTSSTAVGLHLLPSDLIQSILLCLPLPDLLRLRSLSRYLRSLSSSPDFLHLYLRRRPPTPWLFILFKPRHSLPLLRGFDPLSLRWYSFPLSSLPLPPASDLYLLAASSDLLLFASNGLRQLIAVNLASLSLHKIPDSPLGPRRTSSWRRSSLRLLSHSPPHFTFLFADTLPASNLPALFEYSSETNTWRCFHPLPSPNSNRSPNEGNGIYLNVAQIGNETVLLHTDGPVVYRPRFVPDRHVENTSKLHVHGDGHMAVVRSREAAEEGMRVVSEVEVWGLGGDGGGEGWELVSRAPEGVIERARKPYGVMMGCLEERGGAIIRVVLMSNRKGFWDLTWLEFDRGRGVWQWVPVPDCGTQGLNMAGIALSSSFIGFRP